MPRSSVSLENELIRLLTESSSFKKKIVELLRGEIIPYEEIATKSDLKEFFKEMDKRFEAQQNDIAELRKEMDKRFEAQQNEIMELRREMAMRFEAQQREMDKRFEAQQNEIVELRKEMAMRFEAQQREMDKRFEAQQNEIAELRKEMAMRFEAQQNEIVELRKEMDKRFEAQQKEMAMRFEAQQKEMEKRFEAQQNEIVELRKEMDKRFEAQRLEIREWFKLQREEMHDMVSRLGSRWGMETEKTVIKLMTGILEKRFGAKVEKWHEYIPERDREYELDIVIYNDSPIGIEIKSSCTKGELNNFLDACEWYEKRKGVKLAQKIIATPFVREGVEELAKKHNVQIFTGE